MVKAKSKKIAAKLEDSSATEAKHEKIRHQITSLISTITSTTPPRGTLLPPSPFTSFPLSSYTLSALKKGGFTKGTKIQSATLGHCLGGRDVLAAAKTGSGKTLAYVIPLIELLFRTSWGSGDGLGGLILSPTRELAVQIFEVLRIVGSNHSLSAGLITGGKKEFLQEQSSVTRANILVCTPGRLLQHFEQTPDFTADNLQILVLDEADRILDLGFSTQLNRILDYLPSERQTLLFSATQTKSVKDLGRLSLNRPEYVSVDEEESHCTPIELEQTYLTCALGDKLNVLYSFIKSHLKKKTIIFLSSCSQVRFINHIFKSLQPGTPVMALHGKVKQKKRTHIYFEFLEKPSAVLLCTDVASRGLDFPNVDWVIQLDAPEDKQTYIHRVGRTARNGKSGKSLLILLENELKFLEELGTEIPIKKVNVNPTKTLTVNKRASSLVASDVEVNSMAKKAFTSYVKGYNLMPNKDVFDVSSLDLEGYAKSLGLGKQPSVRFLREGGGREENREKKNKSRKLERLKETIKLEKMKKRLGVKEKEEVESEEDNFLEVKRKHDWENEEEEEDAGLVFERRGKKKKTEKKQKILEDGTSIARNKKTTFDDDGNAVDDNVTFEVDTRVGVEEVEDGADEYVKKVKEKLEKVKDRDREDERERIRRKRIKDRGLEERERKGGGEEEEKKKREESEDDSSSSSDSSDSDDDSDSSDLDSDDDDDALAKAEAEALAGI
ncbi:hypothetical protein TrLO_g5827 [Triparma laevis f. longispina]|uniref:ATP-dependent RNA helicase n=2 Tax=Triparma laevis TaxID=1534972 RepID=A0A9W6ZFS3_9STRA|nr:hypothetical protein TrLO_g5827 [Triparma laevis f. longispina]